MSILYFILVIGPLVFFHELGHFLAARRFDVKVEHFAIGFGPPLLTTRRGETEYSIRALPLGGFVYLLGMAPDDHVSEEDKERALTAKPIWQRTIISLAGPLANVLIAIPVFMLMGVMTTTEATPVIGQVFDDSPAADAGLLAGDVVTAIDGREVDSFDDIVDVVKEHPEEELEFDITRDGEAITLTVVPDRIRVLDEMLHMRVIEIGQIGASWRAYGPFIHVSAPDTPAAQAGLSSFDQILSIDGEPIETFIELDQTITSADGEVTLEILRPVPVNDEPTFELVTREVLEVELEVSGRSLEELGLVSAQATIWAVRPGTPAEDAGLARGDRILSVNGDGLTDVRLFTARAADTPEESYAIEYERDGDIRETTLTPLTETVVGDFNTEVEHTFIGLVGLRGATVSPEPRVIPFGKRLVRGFFHGIQRTFEFIIALILGVAFMITGQVDTSSLGGPLMIADFASRAGSAGWIPLLNMAALISVNLAVLNMMPVPGLDGGHIVLYAVEGIQRKPLSTRTRQIASFVGIVCLVLLMIFVFKNDVERYWGDVANWLNS